MASASTDQSREESDEERSFFFEQTQVQLMQSRGDLRSTKPFFQAEAFHTRCPQPQRRRSASMASLPVQRRSPIGRVLPALAKGANRGSSPDVLDESMGATRSDDVLEMARRPEWPRGHSRSQPQLPLLGGAVSAQRGLKGRAIERRRSDPGVERKALTEEAIAWGELPVAGRRPSRPSCQLATPLHQLKGFMVVALPSPCSSSASTRASSRISSRSSSRAGSRPSSGAGRRFSSGF